MSVGKKIKDLRLKNKMTENKLATLMGHSDSRIILSFENDELLPTEIQYQILAQIFGVELDYFKKLSNKEVDDTPKEDVIVKKDFKVLNKYDYILLATINLIFMFIPFINGVNPIKYLYIVIGSLSLILVIYYFIIIKKRNSYNLTTVAVPINKTIRYQNTLDNNMARKFRRDQLTLSILIIIINAFYFGILFTIFKKNNSILTYLLLTAAILIIFSKVYYSINNFRKVEDTNTTLMMMTYLLEMILGAFCLIALVNLGELTKEIGTFVGFNLLMSFLLISVSQFTLSKYQYVIE